MMSARRPLFLCTAALGAALSSPAAALAPAGATSVPLTGSSTGTVSVDISTTPSPLTFFSSGQLSHLGRFTATGNESFTPQGAPPVIPYTVTGTETLVAANGDKLFGAASGTGVNDAGATSGHNVVTITGGTGRFAGASGSFTETYAGQITSQVGTIVSGPITTMIRGRIVMLAPSSAKLSGPPTACVAAPFTAHITGQGIASVRWSLDGRPSRERTLRPGHGLLGLDRPILRCPSVGCARDICSARARSAANAAHTSCRLRRRGRGLPAGLAEHADPVRHGRPADLDFRLTRTLLTPESAGGVRLRMELD